MSTSHDCGKSNKYLIPKLDTTGKNWTIWKFRVDMSLGAKGLKGHLYGTKRKPIDPTSGHLPALIATTPAKINAYEDYETNIVEWDKNDDTTRQQIFWNIPDSLITHLLVKTTATECYETLKEMFKGHSFVICLECRWQLSEMKLKENGDACDHLDKMMAI
ncbi:hypothetical protein PAXRUDRAFT_116441, partial [Paxillus rubicundulus Ve08.2h10]